MSRREIREQIFKILFRIEFNQIEDMPEQLRLFFEQEETIEEKDEQEIRGKYEKIADKLEVIDGMLEEKADKWSVSRMGKVELALLRLAIYEMEFDDNVPVSVAINEAVELAKKFGQDEAPAFINGVLAKFTK
ncbi:MAG: transcription antitermination factor NusB [Roseburia sp.]|nr:transcription antitermination factor NusB [Roseburia sp.]MCM1278460.1 transcription antitermination factor NusB [Robinsoniella sp.]